MQTTVNVAQAFGLVGEMYDTTPRRVDAYEVAGSGAVMGGVAGFNASGKVGKMDATTYTKFAGILVRPHEMVNYGTAGNPLAASIAIAEGVTAQVCSMGDVVVIANDAWADGASVYVTSAGAFTLTASGNTLIGKVLKGGASGEPAVLRLGC
jgi:hypothetical protein